MTGKEEKTKTEMKNADKQGEPGLVRDGVSGHPGHIRHQMMVTSDIRIHKDLTTHSTLTGCSQHRHNKYLSDDENASEEDQVQTTNRISQLLRL